MTTLYISSRANPLIQQMARLKDTAFRKKSGLVMAEGVRTVRTMAQSRLILKYLFTTADHSIHTPSLLQKDTVHAAVSESVMDKLSANKTPNGIIGIFEQPLYDEDTVATPGIVLVNVTDPGNVGTLIRSAVAFGAPTVIVVEGTDPWGVKTVQASAGTIAHASVYTMTWEKLIHIAHQKNITLNALVVDGNSNSVSNRSNQFLVVGNEAHGLCPERQAQCTVRTTIAMPGNTESLNAAVAGSIALYNIFVK